LIEKNRPKILIRKKIYQTAIKSLKR